jgi:hypothetical protein
VGRILRGIAAGLLGGLASLLVAYAGSVVAVAFATKELYPTLLAATALLPHKFQLVQ